jgi:hypothetical protein
VLTFDPIVIGENVGEVVWIWTELAKTSVGVVNLDAVGKDAGGIGEVVDQDVVGENMLQQISRERNTSEGLFLL